MNYTTIQFLFYFIFLLMSKSFSQNEYFNNILTNTILKLHWVDRPLWQTTWYHTKRTEPIDDT